jgi:bifunctional DNA-binding transcriptional regulator/antitoxin component of YhaV-PrlF toxin-antitoxin module
MRDRYILTVEEDPETGDLVLPFTDEILAKCGWQIGDTLTWTVKTNGSIIISKKGDEDEIYPNS